ncbi:MAG: MotA/TolQ/ExbB proton channel family protein [Rickettsiales bacterium]|nr:MotA/TolQ/ExbB proton channel family protein [Rickettsiales bacterium]
MTTQNIDIAQTKSLIDIISNADLVVQFVILILVVASIWSWSIIINKWMQLNQTQRNINKMIKVFSSYNLTEITKYIHSGNNDNSNLFKNILQTCDVYNKQQNSGHKDHGYFEHSIALIKEQFLNVLEKDTTILATISSAAPFIGLFGTVWGIMHSFQSIAASKNTSLVTVAPGIAEALFATGLGLVAAIPALIFYNSINNRINNTESSLNLSIHTLLSKFK